MARYTDRDAPARKKADDRDERLDTPPLPPTVRVAAFLFLFHGVAFGASVPFVQAHLDRHGEFPMTFGFRSMAGPFEKLGPEAFSALGWVFVGVCAGDVIAGLGLWRGRRWGARLGLATSPVAFALGVGFGLPLVLVGVPVRAALVLAGSPKSGLKCSSTSDSRPRTFSGGLPRPGCRVRAG